ncbi:BMP family ABC transporter substrate-binding protein [Microbacterium capsulatum]|uniref:BMP family ABC transporter substrate-binding protein n=1 Tax=Microbacterium capsulatum TaxID=3041921 RepID=A0ABU0XI30_9MICO|nr:BMP family ABC transporter substrate-binding protein [Microbacterium sp. ASV81]MDQ4214522.1 BMP family ABC transporter substrate-binding protein [Microbacterium sp. ASV81]
MTISLTKKLIGATVAAGVIVALAGCGTAPAPASSGAAKPADSNFKPCLVSDSGGFNDKSFNESAKNGMDKAGKTLGVKPLEVESKSDNDYKSNIDALIAGKCTLIIGVGFKLDAAIAAAAIANPKLNFGIIDSIADPDGDGKPDAPNIKPILFDTAQAAYLGGYAAAAWSAQAGGNKVGTFGGMQIPPVTIFMDGFVDGVKKYDEDKGGKVTSVGWDKDSQKGLFTGAFQANDVAKQTANSVLGQGVDVIFPVGGPIYLSASAAVKDSGKKTVMLGVDSDLAVADPSVADQILVSVMKRIDDAVNTTVTEAAKGTFDPTPYVGTLANNGVGLSPFHSFDSKLPKGLKDELTALQSKIVKGDIKVASPSSPK